MAGLPARNNEALTPLHNARGPSSEAILNTVSKKERWSENQNN